MRVPQKLGGVYLGLILLASSVPATAGLINDPLHGYCAGVGQCIDNGTNSPTNLSPPSNFGFTASSGPQSGRLLIDILVPNNEDANPAGITFNLIGTRSGTATLVNTSPWASGFLAGYLGIRASPANPLGAFLPATQGLDAGASGFFVYQADLGITALRGASNPNVFPLENFGPGASLPLASYIVGFLSSGSRFDATANGGAIFDPPPTPIAGANSGEISDPPLTPIAGANSGEISGPLPASVPEPASLAILGTALLCLGGLCAWRNRRG